MESLAVDTALALIGVVCVTAAVVLVLLIIAPWKSVRAEPRLDDDIETRLLLGEDPASIAADVDAEAPGASVHDLSVNAPDDETA